MWRNMWTRLWLIAACGALTLGDSGDTTISVTKSIGDELPTRIQTSQYENFTCNLETPTKEIIQFWLLTERDSDKFKFNPNPIYGCSVTIRITGAEDVGIWRLFIELNDGRTVSQLYNLYVEGLPKLEYLESLYLNTHIGAVHDVTLKVRDFVKIDICNLTSNNDIVYNHGDDIAGVSWITDDDIACGVTINVTGDHLIGNWTLYTIGTKHSIEIETRQPFTVYIEESIKASPERIEAASGTNVLIRLAEPAPYGLQNTCKLVHENKDIDLPYEKNENDIETCGFIIRNVRLKHKGVWHIVLGKTIIYKASIEVNVHENNGSSESYLMWEMDSRVDTVVGPENAVFCSVVDPTGRTVFQDFSECRITIERVTQNHKGTWLLIVGAPGRITTDEHRVHVFVEKSREVALPNVITHVDQHLPELTLSCSLPNDYQVRTCKFRNPRGRVLLAAAGVSEDQLSLSGDNVILSTNVSTTGCSLRITNPTTRALGFWRCALEATVDRTFYGFLKVTSDPGFASEPYYDSAKVVTAPTLTPKGYLDVEEGDAATLFCSIQTQIEYCYFRSANGTVFNVHPGLSTESMEYVGAGFQAGECGLRMKFWPIDNGLWSCHVGLLKASSKDFAPEQSSNIFVDVAQIFQVTQFEKHLGYSVKGQMNLERAIEYCRYVRSDGMGFNEHSLPDRYSSWSYMNTGKCHLIIDKPSEVERQPWTIVTRLRGHREEISRTTNLFIAPPIQPPSPPPPPRRSSSLWFVILMLSISMVFVGLIMSTEKNRRWTSQKAVAIRNSFRFKKKPVANNENVPDVNSGNTPAPTI